MAKKKQKRIFSEVMGIIFIFVGLLIIIAIFFVTKFDILFRSADNQFFGNLGQYIEGFVGSMWNLASILLFIATLKYQKDELAEQGVHLAEQLLQFKEQTEQAKKGNVVLETQKYENTFFQLLRLQNEIVNSVEMEINKLGLPSKDDPSLLIKITGRNCFVEYFRSYKIYFNSYMEDYMSQDFNLGSAKQLIDRSYHSFFEEYQADLGHYFRNLLNIVHFIDSKDFLDKHFYRNLICAQLSNYELLLLFFHCLSEMGKEFKPLVEKFSLLENTPEDEFVVLTKELYDKKAFGTTEYGYHAVQENANHSGAANKAQNAGDSNDNDSDFSGDKSFDDELTERKVSESIPFKSGMTNIDLEALFDDNDLSKMKAEDIDIDKMFGPESASRSFEEASAKDIKDEIENIFIDNNIPEDKSEEFAIKDVFADGIYESSSDIFGEMDDDIFAGDDDFFKLKGISDDGLVGNGQISFDDIDSGTFVESFEPEQEVNEIDSIFLTGASSGKSPDTFRSETDIDSIFLSGASSGKGSGKSMPKPDTESDPFEPENFKLSDFLNSSPKFQSEPKKPTGKPEQKPAGKPVAKPTVRPSLTLAAKPGARAESLNKPFAKLPKTDLGKAAPRPAPSAPETNIKTKADSPAPAGKGTTPKPEFESKTTAKPKGAVNSPPANDFGKSILNKWNKEKRSPNN